MISFKDKILLITGGTGSFGNAVLRRFLTTDIAEIRILSRDEKKQDDMRHTYQEMYPQYAEKIKFYIGDVRDYNSILNAFRGVDYVFHAAALKHGLDVGEHLTGLTLNATLGNGAGLGYQRHLTGQEYQVAAVDGVGIGARSGRGFLGKDHLFHITYLLL